MQNTDRKTLLNAVSRRLFVVITAEQEIAGFLNVLFPAGSYVSVKIRDNVEPSVLCVLGHDGDGYIRAYKDTPGHQRFARDYFYTRCTLIEKEPK